jgi:hypothetical protein
LLVRLATCLFELRTYRRCFARSPCATVAKRLCAIDICRKRQVADNNLGTGCAQHICAFIFATDKRTDRQSAFANQLHNNTANGT